MTEITEFVKNMVVADQTKLVETIFSSDYWPSYDDIIFPDRKQEEDEDEDEEEIEFYAWKLINPWYVDIIEEGDMPYFQFRGQTWLGKTNTNCLTEWQYLKDYIKKRK